MRLFGFDGGADDDADGLMDDVLGGVLDKMDFGGNIELKLPLPIGG
jgi:hypothetical protein